MAKRKRFTTEFKREAVKMMADSGKAPADIARELGIHRNQLYKWKEQLGTTETNATTGMKARQDGMDELTRLREELERVKEERDIFKKAAAFFAKEVA
jgi:transposase-like protein